MLYRIKAKNIYLDKREQVFFLFKYFIEKEKKNEE